MRTLFTLIAGLAGVMVVTVTTAQNRPNILWIISEDMSYDIGCYGNSIVKTPNLDKLAAEGMRFTGMFTTAAVCAPSRTAIATGMYQNSIGAMHMRYPESLKPALPGNVRTVEDLLRDHGYQTLGIGKDDYMFKTDERGFAYYAIEALDKNKPFFAKVNSTYPHRPFKEDTANPVNPSRIALPPYCPDVELIRDDWAAYMESVQLLDTEVGAILKTFGERGLLENTVVFFFSDHGRPFLRAKYWTYDTGIRIPFIVYVSEDLKAPLGYQPGTVSNQMLSAIDISATTLALAGLKKPDYMQGRIFLGEQKEPEREFVFSAIDRISGTYFKTRAVRSHKYKYIRNFNNGRSVLECTTEYAKAMYPEYNAVSILDNYNKLSDVEKLLVTPLPLEELYDVENDPFETVNLADRPELQKTRSGFEAVLNDWIEEIDDKGFKPDSPEIQKHFIDTRTNDKEKYREARLKGYRKAEQQLKSAGKI